MLLKYLTLRKEEIPILHDNYFQVPIHPILLNPNVKIDEDLAKAVFPKAVEEWYNELREYSKTLENKNSKRWIDKVFLKKKPKIKKEYGNQILDTLNWKDSIFTLENGFTYSFSINRNAGGSLYFNKDDTNCKTFIPINVDKERIRFSEDKTLEFNIGNNTISLDNGIKGVEAYVYGTHNVDYYPGALFLRNWAILYLNDAIKQVLK